MPAHSEIHLPLHADFSLQPASIRGNSSDYVDWLEGQGVSEVRFTGLNQLNAQAINGEYVDEIQGPVDPDVLFLLGYYRQLESLVANGTHGHLTTYLWDGLFHINSTIETDEVSVCAGLTPWGQERVYIPIRQYIAMWRSVAHAIARVHP
ncbi:hypothetical protein ACN6A1_06180 [Myxococcus virescens]|uniref:hypothetical protein n=1 Tax=Myxococcus virescens TaxID=83456 RepID=UPI003DA5C33D